MTKIAVNRADCVHHTFETSLSVTSEPESF